jgi:hypothetical protein
VSGDPLQYDRMMEEAARGVVRKALDIIAERGLIGAHHFYITFRTDRPGVDIPEHLRQRYPQEMTIVLQHQFWGLEVTDQTLSVTLSFDGKHEQLVVPLSTIVAFVDPSVQWGLQFPAVGAPPALAASTSVPPGAAASEKSAEPAAKPMPTGEKVVTLDAFRKK